MRRALSACLLLTLGLFGIAAAQEPTSHLAPRYGLGRPSRPIDPVAYRALAQDGKALPFWGAFFQYLGDFYGFYMIGTDPSLGSATSVIDTVVVPVALRFADGHVLDPTQPVQCHGSASPATIVQHSPIFENVDWVQGGTDVGTTQYIDAFQRAEWWNFANGSAPDYHVLLNPIAGKKVVIDVPANQGRTHSAHGCGIYGDVEGLYFDKQLQNLIVKLGLQPNQFPYFLTYDVVADHGVLGYHSTFGNTIYATGTYVDQNLGPNHAYQDMVVTSHVIGSAFNDPFNTNLTPEWQSSFAPQAGCNSFMEAGDPLPGLAEPVRVPGVPHQYYVQDLAFELWFAHAPASTSVNGWFSMFGTFTNSADSCQ